MTEKVIFTKRKTKFVVVRHNTITYGILYECNNITNVDEFLVISVVHATFYTCK